MKALSTILRIICARIGLVPTSGPVLDEEIKKDVLGDNKKLEIKLFYENVQAEDSAHPKTPSGKGQKRITHNFNDCASCIQHCPRFVFDILYCGN